MQSYQLDVSRSWYSPKIELFFKGWYVLVLAKLLLSGPLFQDVVEFQQATGNLDPDRLFSPGLSRVLIIIVLSIGIILKRNYWLSVAMFLVTLWAHRLIHPVVNGGDLVMLFFMFLGIFCNTRPQFQASNLTGSLQILVTNFSILLGQIHVAFIYLVSGWDKLDSLSWRNGTALFNLLHVDFYATNWVHRLTDGLEPGALAGISCMVIIFELAFPVLVWFRALRYYVLLAGVVFHLFIGIGLSLPDFALVMIWCYLLFLRDEGSKVIPGLKQLSVSWSLLE